MKNKTFGPPYSDQNLEEIRNKKVFFQQWQSEQPVVKVIS
jgi:hypothetical protein